jgi:hypothetical protein
MFDQTNIIYTSLILAGAILVSVTLAILLTHYITK